MGFAMIWGDVRVSVPLRCAHMSGFHAVACNSVAASTLQCCPPHAHGTLYLGVLQWDSNFGSYLHEGSPALAVSSRLSTWRFSLLQLQRALGGHLAVSIVSGPPQNTPQNTILKKGTPPKKYLIWGSPIEGFGKIQY